jgi:hypothetical protein
MNPDLERVVALQRLDTGAYEAKRRLDEEPERQRTLDARLDAARERVAAARAQLAESQDARRTLEKDAAVHQGRLSKFREQAMAVKTNQEYHAVQKEIEFAQKEIKAIEDQVLERMLEADDLTALVKRSEAELAAEEARVAEGRRALTAELAALRASLERIAAERLELTRSLDPQVLTTFDLVARRRNGVAVAEARDGICTICHVRLRPQIFNTVRRNEGILQCESCQRILYFVPTGPVPADSKTGQVPS